MSGLKFCVLIPSHPHLRSAVQHKRLNISAYFGLKIVLNELKKDFGIVPKLVTYDQVHKYDVVLVSMLSVEDFYRVAFTFYHRLKGVKNAYWLGGGAAVQNLAPLSEIFDTVLIGRAEGVLNGLITSILNGTVYIHPSVVHFNAYRENQSYKINYVKNLYPEILDNEKETMSGCRYNCGYCRYRIAALPPKMRDTDKHTTMPGNEETFWELEILNSKPHTTSLDGFEQSIRYAVSKRISDEAVVNKLIEIGLVQKKVSLKIYLICAYPHHSAFDFSTIRDLLARVDKASTGLSFTITFHVTPFSPEPGTPMQWEPVNIAVNYNLTMRAFKKQVGSVFISDQITAYVLNSTMSNWAVLLRAIHHRMSLNDMAILRAISSDVYYRSHHHSYTDKFNKLIQDFDVSRYICSYPTGHFLPSSNITSWRSNQSILRQGQGIRKKLLSSSPQVPAGNISVPLVISPLFASLYPDCLPSDLM